MVTQSHTKDFSAGRVSPRQEKVFPTRVLHLALESALSLVFWDMNSRTRDFGMPRLCPWSIEDLEYDGLCSHVALAEGIWGECDGPTPEQIAVKEVEMEQRRKAQKVAAVQKHYWDFKRDNFAAWQAQRRRYAANCDPAERKATAKKVKAKAFAAKKWCCDLCNVSCRDSHELVRHNTTPSHKNKVAGIAKPAPKAAGYQTWNDANKLAKKHYCKPCNYSAGTTQKLDKHLLTTKHKVKAAAAAEAAA